MGLRLSAGGAQECFWPWTAKDQVQDPSRLPGPEWVGETLGAFPLNPLILEGASPLASLLPLPMPQDPHSQRGL